MADVLFGAFLFAICSYVVRTWVRWFHGGAELVAPKWRSGITTFGFAASSVFLITILLLILYGLMSHSFTPYDRTALLGYRVIFVTSLSAIVAGIIGTGPLERPTFVCSLLCLLMLVVEGFAS